MPSMTWLLVLCLSVLTCQLSVGFSSILVHATPIPTLPPHVDAPARPLYARGNLADSAARTGLRALSKEASVMKSLAPKEPLLSPKGLLAWYAPKKAAAAAAADDAGAALVRKKAPSTAAEVAADALAQTQTASEEATKDADAAWARLQDYAQKNVHALVKSGGPEDPRFIKLHKTATDAKKRAQAAGDAYRVAAARDAFAKKYATDAPRSAAERETAATIAQRVATLEAKLTVMLPQKLTAARASSDAALSTWRAAKATEATAQAAVDAAGNSPSKEVLAKLATAKAATAAASLELQATEQVLTEVYEKYSKAGGRL